jgi:DNA-binding response OmpR family regulator
VPKLLIIEDDENLLNTIQDWFKAQKYEIESSIDGREGLEKLKFYEYDLVILDWGLPNISGVDICKEYRAGGGVTPILMLTGRDQIDHKESGFSAGADDYLTKPFSLRELSARVRALLRRPTTFVAENIKIGSLRIDPAALKVTRDDKDLTLAPREFALLEFLMRHPDQVFTDEAILNRVWPSSSDASSETLRTCIKKLRRKIDKEGGNSVIKNVPGVGYRFDSTVE